MAKPDMTIKIETEIFENGDLASTVSSDYLGKFKKTIVSTIDQQVRDSLIKLGWSPPLESHDEWIKELETNAKTAKMSSEGSLFENLGYCDEYNVDYSPSFDSIDLHGTFTINQLESLLKHMKKYAK